MKKFISLVIATVMAMTALSFNAFALIEDEGYLYADTIDFINDPVDSLTSADDEHWYTFNITTANAPYSISLKNAPSVGAYSYELRYQQTAGTRPIIIANEPYIKTSNGRVNMSGVLHDTGNYYIRVFSLTGAYSSSPYTLTVDVSYGWHNATISTISVASNYDWAACAAMAGRAAHYNEFGVYPSRTYINATKFIKSGGTAESAATPQFTPRPDTDVVATAANYIFSGDYMENPVFEVKTQNFTCGDFLDYVWKLDKKHNSNPVIIKILDIDDPTSYSSRKYLTVYGVNMSTDSIKVANPDGGSTDNLDLTALYSGEIEEYNCWRYAGNNVVFNQ